MQIARKSFPSDSVKSKGFVVEKQSQTGRRATRAFRWLRSDIELKLFYLSSDSGFCPLLRVAKDSVAPAVSPAL